MYEALHVANTKPSDRVGIVGLGGLGHLAVMYARAMGCKVVVFSGNESKRADAIALGATEFCVFPPTEGATLEPKYDINVMLLCGGALPNFEMFVLSPYREYSSTDRD